MAVVLAGSWACGSSGASARDPFRGDAGMQRLRLAVTNRNWDDATLYVLRGSERRRLGVVVGKGDAEFVVRWPTTTILRVEIELRSGESCVTRPVPARPGERVHVEIAAELSLDPECRGGGGPGHPS